MRCLILLIIILAGCQSGGAEIARGSTEISDLAHQSRGRFVYINSEAQVVNPNMSEIVLQSAAGIEEQESIIESVARIIHSLPGVRDITPWWAEALTWILIFLSLIGTVVLMAHLGVFTFIRSVFSSITITKKAPSA